MQVFNLKVHNITKSKWLVTNLLINNVKARDPVGSKNTCNMDTFQNTRGF